MGTWGVWEPLVLGCAGVGSPSVSSCPGVLTSNSLARAGPGFGLVFCSGSRGGSYLSGWVWYMTAGELGTRVSLYVPGCGGRAQGWLNVVCRMYPTLNWSGLSPHRIRYGDRGGDIEG